VASGLTIDGLRAAVADGAVDTVLLTISDVQGRLHWERYRGFEPL
jgi:hypothetical protein